MARSVDGCPPLTEGGDEIERSSPNPPHRRYSLDPTMHQGQDILSKDNVKQVVSWGMRFFRLLHEHRTKRVIAEINLWDAMVFKIARNFIRHQASQDNPTARELLEVPRARSSHLTYLPAWREEASSLLDLPQAAECELRPIGTIMDVDPKAMTRPIFSLPDPLEQEHVSQSDEGHHLSEEPYNAHNHQNLRQALGHAYSGDDIPRRPTSEETVDFPRRCQHDPTLVTTASTSLDGERFTPIFNTPDGVEGGCVQEGPVGTFDPSYKDPSRQGMVSADGGNIYTDVHLFCEYLNTFELFGSDSLRPYYTEMLKGPANGWLMGELNSQQRKELLHSDIQQFTRQLIRRFKRPDSELQEELGTDAYTIKLAREGISLTQWVLRKAIAAKQAGITKDSEIMDQIFKRIDPKIVPLLPSPDESTTLSDFVRECEKRRHAINAVVLREEGSQPKNSRQSFSAPFSEDYDDSNHRRDHDRDRNHQRGRERQYDRPRDNYDKPHGREGQDDQPSDDYNARDDRDLRGCSKSYNHIGDYHNRKFGSGKEFGFEKKHPAEEQSDNSRPSSLRVNLAPSDASDTSDNQDRVYRTVIAGRPGDAVPTSTSPVSCQTRQSLLSSEEVLQEHHIAQTCISQEALKREVPTAVPKTTKCRMCKRIFDSRNALFRHLDAGCTGKSSNGVITADKPMFPVMDQIIHAIPIPQERQNVGYSPARIQVKASLEDQHPVEVCVVTGRGNSVVDRTWLQTLRHTIEKKIPITNNEVRGQPRLADWATFDFYIEGYGTEGKLTKIAKFTTSAWVQDGLNSNALLGNAFIDSYHMDIMFSQEVLCCNVLHDFHIPFLYSTYQASNSN